MSSFSGNQTSGKGAVSKGTDVSSWAAASDAAAFVSLVLALVSDVLAFVSDVLALVSDVLAFVSLVLALVADVAAAVLDEFAFVSDVFAFFADASAAAALVPAAIAAAISFDQLGPVFLDPSARVTVTSPVPDKIRSWLMILLCARRNPSETAFAKSSSSVAIHDVLKMKNPAGAGLCGLRL
ncbi:hypothetical protein EXN74_13690 [Leclercia adecarboxylata]|nr:hypothetical protein EXN74_13690 [Leclercia adecarboxylata]